MSNNKEEFKSENWEIFIREEAGDNTALPISVVYTSEIYDKIVKILTEVEGINKILFLRSENVFYIWTIIYENNKNTRCSVYGKELEIIKELSAFSFDFNLAKENDVERLLSAGAKKIYPG